MELARTQATVARFHPRTPLTRSRYLSDATGRDVYLKLESHGPVRSFKSRGALALVANLDTPMRQRGVITASTGNHGQGVAFAGQALGARTRIVIPHGVPSIKVKSMVALGADLVTAGQNLAEAASVAFEIAQKEGLAYVEDGESRDLMIGAASMTMEILEVLPAVRTIVVPVGGGNLIASACVAAEAAGSTVRIVGVQSAAAPAVFQSWEQRELVRANCDTIAGGLATSYPGKLALDVILRRVDEVRLVTEDDLQMGVITLLHKCGYLAETAAAATVAALHKYDEEWPAGPVVLVLSGSNIDQAELARLMSRNTPALAFGELEPA